MKAIDRLKRRVESTYGFKIKKWEIIKNKNKSSVVIKIITMRNESYVLKCLYVKPERQGFITTSEQLLSERGVNLAQPISTLKGELFMLYNNYPYVLYRWIEGEGSQLNNEDDLEAIIEVMAKFHQASRDLQYPSGIKIYEHLHWNEEYKARLKTIENWLPTHKNSSNKNKKIINRHIPFFKGVAQKALSELENSNYESYINGPLLVKSLVHGDLHHNNILYKKNMWAFIDFEDIRYDLPSKDILRIYSMYTKNHPFKGESFSKMMNIYERNHALSPDVKHLVCIDLLFPHIFERLLRKKKYSGMNTKELEHRINQEKKKASYIYKHYFNNNNLKNGSDGGA